MITTTVWIIYCSVHCHITICQIKYINLITSTYQSTLSFGQKAVCIFLQSGHFPLHGTSSFSGCGHNFHFKHECLKCDKPIELKTQWSSFSYTKQTKRCVHTIGAAAVVVVLTMAVVQLSKQLIEIILVGNPLVLQTQQISLVTPFSNNKSV